MQIITLGTETSDFTMDDNEDTAALSESNGEEEHIDFVESHSSDEDIETDLEDSGDEAVDSDSKLHAEEDGDENEEVSDIEEVSDLESSDALGEDEDDDDNKEEIEDSNEGSNDSNAELNMDEDTIGNAGWADAISKVLRTNKPKNKKTLVLSRAKKINDPKYISEPTSEGPGFEIDGEIKTEEEEKPKLTVPRVSTAKEKEIKRKRKEWENLCRIKPKVLEKDRERALSKIATKGVVQLFNAVRQQQKTIESNMKAAGSSERRQEKVLRSVDKNSFLDILMGPTRSTLVSHNSKSKTPEDIKPTIKLEDDKQKAPLWSVLRDDFLVSGKLKDWDRAPSKGNEEEKGEGSSPDDDSDCEM